MTKEKSTWVTYPEIYPTVDEYLKYINMQENERLNSEETIIPEINTPIEEMITPENTMPTEDVAGDTIIDGEDELSDEEKKEIKIKQLKESKIKFRPIVHGVEVTIGIEKESDFLGRGTRTVKQKAILTNETTNQFGKEYKAKRKRKNKLTKQSRKVNR